MEAEKEKNNALMNAHLREQQNVASTSSPSLSPPMVPDSMPTLNIGYHASTELITAHN
jgi:MADS-box transcription factor